MTWPQILLAILLAFVGSELTGFFRLLARWIVKRSIKRWIPAKSQVRLRNEWLSHIEGMDTQPQILQLYQAITIAINAAPRMGAELKGYSYTGLMRIENVVMLRLLDLSLAIMMLIIAVPLIALATLWIVVVSPGNPFYAQKREGKGGKPIRVWKLRTTYSHAEVLLAKHLRENAEAHKEWEKSYKLKRDSRILPRIGSLLRRTSLDELPQLFNILKGEMSFIGPRPFPYYHLERFDEEFRTLRSTVKPGLTGLWQVSARSDGDLTLQRELDSYYIRNWSLWLTLYLLAWTPWAVLSGKGVDIPK
jgi:lipopolysaccharide/colanic/teichoic acid biosynthesis glycosyltransferase